MSVFLCYYVVISVSSLMLLVWRCVVADLSERWVARRSSAKNPRGGVSILVRTKMNIVNFC